MAGERERRAARVRAAVLRYLRDYPEARDTAAGIVAWWLPVTGFEDAADLIGDVLEALVRDAVLARTTLPDGGVLFAAVAPGGNDGD